MEETSEDALLKSLNSAWAKLTITEGYNLVFSFGEQAYRITSDGGRLRAEALQPPEVKAALASTATHVAVPNAKHVASLQSAEGALGLQGKRQMLVAGDGGQMRALAAELGPAQAAVQAELHATARALNLNLEEEGPGVETEEDDRQKSRAVVATTASQAAMIIGGSTWHPMTYQEGFEKMFASKLKTFIHFSAFTTMVGNVGQGNYTAANAMLDGYAFHARTVSLISSPMAYMWGAVQGIGMRLKAFGSQDLLEASAPELMFSADEAGIILKLVVGLCNCAGCCEWVSGHIFDEVTRAQIAGTPVRGDGSALIAAQLDGVEEDIEEQPRDDSKAVVGALAQKINDALAAEAKTAMERWFGSSAAEDAANLKDYKEALARQRRFKDGELEATTLAPLLRAHLKEQEDEASTEAGDSQTGSSCSSSAASLAGSERSAISRTMASYMARAAASSLHPQSAEEMHIAGSWSNWLPQAFDCWDEEQRCYWVTVEIPAGEAASFQLLKGRAPACPPSAGVKPAPNRRTIPAQAAARSVDIRVNIRNDGRMMSVVWSDSSKNQSEQRRPAPDTAAATVAVVQQGMEMGKAKAKVKPAPHLLAGSWDGWLAKTFAWNEARQCYLCQVTVTEKTATFQVLRGSLASDGKERRIKPSPAAKYWPLKSGAWEIFGLPDDAGRIKKVEWERLQDLETAAAEESPDIQQQPELVQAKRAAPRLPPPRLSLREVLFAAKPEWTSGQLDAVAAKLRKVGINSAEQLAAAMAGNWLNRSLKEACEKAFAAETLQQLSQALALSSDNCTAPPDVVTK